MPNMNPYPGPQSVILLDNCSTHKSAALRDIVEETGEYISLSRYIFLANYHQRLPFTFSATILSRFQPYRRELQLR